MLVRLMYASRATEAICQDTLHSILRKSKANNARLGITGVLCFSERIFIQVLEGGRNAVNELYLRIAADPRHHDVVLLSYEELCERRFTGWSMGQVNTSRLNTSMLLKYSETAALDPYAISGKATVALFDELLETALIMGRE